MMDGERALVHRASDGEGKGDRDDRVDALMRWHVDDHADIQNLPRHFATFAPNGATEEANTLPILCNQEWYAPWTVALQHFISCQCSSVQSPSVACDWAWISCSLYRMINDHIVFLSGSAPKKQLSS